MRLVAQRVRAASVTWGEGEGAQQRRIGRGLAILVGAGPTSDRAQAAHLATKLAALRIFPDPARPGSFNLSLTDVGGEALVVSQFTLYADTSRGRRPGFTTAAAPAHAQPLVEHFAETLKTLGVPTQTGSFGAEMLVEIENEGPVTIVLSTDDWPTRV